MAKYDTKFKYEVVRRCLKGGKSARAAGKEFGIDHATVHRWVQRYRHHGLNGLNKKHEYYSAEFKLSVLKRMKKEGLSYREVEAMFNLRGVSTVSRWERLYHEHGLDGLKPKPRGRPKMMKPKIPPNPLKTKAEDARTRQDLLDEIEYLRAEVDYLKKRKALIQAKKAAAQKARLVQELRPHHKLSILLRITGLARSTFYYQVRAQAADDKYAAVKTHICKVYELHKGRYGYRRITTTLRKAGEVINHKTVQRLMLQLGLKSLVRPKKYRSYRGPGHVSVANVLQRQFKAERFGEKWVTDVTEFNVSGEKLYLSPVMDLYNGEIVAYQTSRSPQFHLVKSMLKKAIATLKGVTRPMLHSDQGWQYQMHAYRRTLAETGITQSMSRRGNCLDNAAMESFFGTLKSECFYLQRFSCIDQLQTEIRKYIHYYNHHRIKTKLKGLSPVQYRT
ncbi:IS3 family transposase, partial [Herbaspirillum huttiense]|uniref:IS3 family transposase n=1 Tax=Herbaspirillum huttiense TaxID=863372 RepID=UPI00381DA898